MSDISNISGISNSKIDFSSLLSDETKKKTGQDLFSEILSSLMAPPPPPPPKDQPMDLEKLSEIISSSKSISDTDKKELLSLIDKIVQYTEDNDLQSIFASMYSRKELTEDQKKILDTLKAYQGQLAECLRDIFENENDLSVGTTETDSGNSSV